MFNLAYPNEFKLLWVVDFPLFEYSEKEQRYLAAHHPFTMTKPESLDTFDVNKKDAIAYAYDLVMNGFEIGGVVKELLILKFTKNVWCNWTNKRKSWN